MPEKRSYDLSHVDSRSIATPLEKVHHGSLDLQRNLGFSLVVKNRVGLIPKLVIPVMIGP